MARSVRISFDPVAGLHRIRNYTERLSLDVPKISGFLSMDDADRATDYVVVTEIHARKLKRVLAFVAKLLERASLAERGDGRSGRVKFLRPASSADLAEPIT